MPEPIVTSWAPPRHAGMSCTCLHRDPAECHKRKRQFTGAVARGHGIECRCKCHGDRVREGKS